MTKYLTIPQVSERTEFTEKAIRCLIARGLFPYTKISGRIRIAENELERFMELSRRVSAEEAAARREAA